MSVGFEHVGVVGAGSWGTALGLLLHGNGLSVTVWGHDESAVARIIADRENKTYLPGIPLPANLRFTSDLDALRDAGLVVLVTHESSRRTIHAPANRKPSR